MYYRDFDSVFGDTDRPIWDVSKLDVLDRNTTIEDGPAGTVLPGHLNGTEIGGPDNPEGQGFTVHLLAGVTYSFAERPTATGGIEDPFLLLYNSGGTLVAYDDDGGFGRSSLLSFTPTADGDYTIVGGSWVNLFDTGGDAGNFTISQWDNTTPDTGATMATAFEITTGTTFGQLNTNADIDMYKIDVDAGMFYTFNYSGGYDGAGETGNIARLQLFDSGGNLVKSSLATESGFGFFAPGDGTYYVKITPYVPLGTATGGYTLDVSSVDPATKDPLDAIRWKSANNISTVDVNGVPTIYIYFGAAGESFGQTEPSNPALPMATFGWQQNQIDAVMNAMATSYTPITGIHYVQTTDVNQAQLKLVTTVNTVFGARFYPQDPANGSLQGVGSFNLASGGFGTDPASLLQGGFSYAVILHEFGHAHGLAHPHDNGGGSDILLGVVGSTGASSYGIYNLNQGVYTVMSYNDGWPLDPDGQRVYSPTTRQSGWSGSLSAFDIAVLQERYGEHAFNTGDNTYTIADTQASAMYQCIWDTGGNDTIAYTGARNVQIDLLAATLDYSPTGGGVLSFAHGVFGGYTIAHGVVIENATGGSGNDALLGNSANNVLTGNGGNDALMGRDGIDTASYANAGAAVVADLAAGTATGGDGSDTLDSIENLIGSAYDDTLLGTAGINVLTGNNGNDTMNGRAGDDLLIAGAGDDVVYGGDGFDVISLGAGADRFVEEIGTTKSTLKGPQKGAMPVDVITDFGAGDKIDLSGIGHFNFKGTSANKGAWDLTYKTFDSVNGAESALGIDIDGHAGASGISGPVTVVFGNNASGGDADFAIILLNHSSVAAGDFING